MSIVWWKYGLLVFYGGLTAIGVFGNFAVCVIVYKTKSMRTTTNVYLVSLAVSDTIFFITALPAEIHDLFGVSQYFGVAGCALRAFLPYLAMNTSSLNIVAFSLERFIAICYPVKSRYLCTVYRACVIVAGVWLFSVVYNSPWLFLTSTRLTTTNITMCSFRLDRTHVFYKLMYGLDCIVFYMLPIILYIFIYARIYYGLRTRPQNSQHPSPRRSRVPDHHHNHHRTTDTDRTYLSPNLAKRSAPAALSCSSHHLSLPTSPKLSDPRQVRKVPVTGETRPLKINLMKRQSNSVQSRQIVTMLAVVTSLFAILWLPYKAGILYNSFVSTKWTPTAYWTFSKALIFINSAINPIVYNAMSSKFRRAFKCLLCDDLKTVPHIPTEEGSHCRYSRGGTTDTDSYNRRMMSPSSSRSVELTRPQSEKTVEMVSVV